MRIGDFARIGNVSVRAVRFYDQAHLLEASYVDANSRYRHYDVRQVARLLEIRALRELGFSLREIHELLRQDLSPADLRTLMEERRSELRRHIRDDVRRLERLEERIHNLSSQVVSQVSLRETKPMWVVSLRERIPRYEEAEKMFQELERKVSPRFLAGERCALWHACEASAGPIDCEVVRRLKRPITSLRGLRIYELAALTVASAFHYGADDTASESYKYLNHWLAGGDYRLDGAKREIYWVEGGNGKAIDAVTEIQFPVKVSTRRRWTA